MGGPGGGSVSSMFSYIGQRINVLLVDHRTMAGDFLAYDRHMNLVLGNTLESRKVKSDEGGSVPLTRELGLVVLRGEMVQSISLERQKKERTSKPAGVKGSSGPGVAVPAGRGVPLAGKTGVKRDRE